VAAKRTERLLGLAATIHSHKGFADVIASLREGHGGAVGGTWGSACALATTAIERGLPEEGPRSLVVVLPHASDCDAFADDLAVFSDAAVAVLPAIESFGDDDAVDEPAVAERLAVVKALTRPGGSPPRILVTSIQALLTPLADPREIEESTRSLCIGGRLDPAELADWLVARGWHAADAVEEPGTFARRGGIVDLFAIDWDRPVRVELLGDEIESLRTFDIASQRSVASLESIDLTALVSRSKPKPDDAVPRPTKGRPRSQSGKESVRRTQLSDVLPQGSWWALVEPLELAEEARRAFERIRGVVENASEPDDVFTRIYRSPSVTLSCIAPSSLEASAELSVESVERFTGVLERVKEELETVGRDQEVWIVCPTDAEIERLTELLADTAPARSGRLHFAPGKISAGFRLVPEKLAVIGSGELFRREDAAAARAPRRRLSRAIDTFLDLHDGDYVVHVGHGIGRYKGLKVLEKQGRTEEFLEIEFAESTKIFVPASCIDLVQKYVGGTKLAPKLAKLGGKTWEKQKQAVRDAVADMASDMIRLQATRASRPGISFPAPTAWQREFEESFPFDETPDQLTAAEAIRDDMEKPRPMDRLLCGDVGFGKTEMAMRAAFKAVEAGYQVAVLVPTTVLAEQHCSSFQARFAEFPFTIRSLSRFSTLQEERDVLEGILSGKVDIVVGTHRLAQNDVAFRNLGLLVIDEEQRFGVDVKERLKALRSTVDVLTMTATPIPRTLHMSLLGIRDISSLATPPPDRQPVETRVARWDDALIRSAIERELARQGQVFFVHNRIHDIHLVAQKLARIVPEARIGIGHGRLSEKELEEVMVDFVAGRTDILLATTIIESGLDIPRANTIFIDESDTYGLADLHQLRGRVGRSHHRAYCYMLVDGGKPLTGTATRRLRAIQEFSSIGAGFSLAMRDLEIRGAGNLLGTQQSGHIATVGYELYCRLLEQAVRGLKAMPPAEPPPVHVDLPGEAWFPREYLADFRAKIDFYRRLSRATKESEIDDLAAELTDRFGPAPAEVLRLLEFSRLRIAAAGLGVAAIRRQNDLLMLTFHEGGRKTRNTLERLKGKVGGRLRIVDDRTAALPLTATDVESPDRLVAAVKTLLMRDRRPPYSPAPAPAATP
jgi:transcription-repair coupling factor (superfamily II helicase)